MRNIFSVFKLALSDFNKNKGRTMLTSLGITIGVLSVVLLIAAGNGLRVFIEQQFESLGTNLVYAVPGGIFNSSGGFSSQGGAATGPIFEEKDVIALKRITEAEYVTPIYYKSSKMEYQGKAEYGSIYATSSNIFDARSLKAEYGTIFSEADNSSRNKVVVLGPKIAENLFDIAALAVGKKVKIDNISYLVIGVVESKGGGGLGGPDFDSFIYMPYKTAYTFNTSKKFIQILVKARNKDTIPVLKQKMEEVLLKDYKEDDFSVIESTEVLDAVSSIFNILNVVLIAIATISLIVGGVGILNIMYVTVTERIKEVGIRRSLGARKSDILWQFLSEAISLSIIGGVMGLVLSEAIVLLVKPIFPAYISFESVLLAIGTSTLIGVVFGVFPAKKAAELSPIEAIRYE